MLYNPPAVCFYSHSKSYANGRHFYSAGRCIFTVALLNRHRIRTVAGADQVIALADGTVAQQGTPDELMAIGGLYRLMVLRQRNECAMRYRVRLRSAFDIVFLIRNILPLLRSTS